MLSYDVYFADSGIQPMQYVYSNLTDVTTYSQSKQVYNTFPHISLETNNNFFLILHNIIQYSFTEIKCSERVELKTVK